MGKNTKKKDEKLEKLMSGSWSYDLDVCSCESSPGGSGGTSFTPGNALELTSAGVLNVQTTDDAESGNTKPITSSGVAEVVGDIETILNNI